MAKAITSIAPFFAPPAYTSLPCPLTASNIANRASRPLTPHPPRLSQRRSIHLDGLVYPQLATTAGRERARKQVGGFNAYHTSHFECSVARLFMLASGARLRALSTLTVILVVYFPFSRLFSESTNASLICHAWMHQRRSGKPRGRYNPLSPCPRKK